MKAQTAADILESIPWRDVTKRVIERLDDALHRADPEDGQLLRKVAHQRAAVRYIISELERELRESSPNLRNVKK